VRECDRDTNKFLPAFEQWDDFGNPDVIGAVCPEADVREFSDKYLDEIYELTKAIRQSVFQHSADTLPSLAQTCDSEDTLQRDIQWFVESWNAFKNLGERIETHQPLATSIPKSPL
jgi:predicted phage-related endonuclease